MTKSQYYEAPRPIVQDNRSRAEVREDFEKKLKSIDMSVIEGLKDKIIDIREPEEMMALKEDIEDSLIKFIRYYERFEDLNSDESRKVALKEKELKLESRYDWREKARLFFFRVLGSALVIVTLFVIGYVEHEYEWAHLPMSKYLSTSTKLP
ncbi:MAG: hypothetical protein GYB38_08505 [Gammaproteobacteria bacterium]|nr:hypothetical protein [Gammaproteobacteria bacterium]